MFYHKKVLTKLSIYLETTIISYYANSLSPYLSVAAHQNTTKEWWDTTLPLFDAYISDLVVSEISKGSIDQAQARLLAVKSIPFLKIDQDVLDLSMYLLKKLSLPREGEADATHLAIAIVHEVDFLLSWNCKHIANAFKYPLINKIKNQFGYKKPLIICTPLELTRDK